MLLNRLYREASVEHTFQCFLSRVARVPITRVMSGPRAAGFEFYFIGSKLHGGIKAREAIADFAIARLWVI